MRCTRLTLLIGLSASISPSVQAQPILWGTASANASFPNGRLMRIDYASGAIEATFNGPSDVLIGDGFTGVAIRPSNGQVFVTDGAGTNRVFRIDPVTGAALSSFQSPTGSNSVDGLEFLGDVLYASQVAGAIIVRIDPDTGAQIGTPFPGIAGSVQGGLTIAQDFLFSAGSTGNTRIARRDLATGTVLGEFDTPNNEAIRALASDGTSLYAASDTGFIYRLEPMTGSVLDSRNIGIVLDGLGGPAPIPEPSAALLLLTTFVVGYARRGRRR